MNLKDLEQHELCTREEISEILRISTRTLDRMLLEGQIKYIKFGDGQKGAVRIPKSEIYRLLDEAAEQQAEKARAHAGKKKRKVHITPIQSEQITTGDSSNEE